MRLLGAVALLIWLAGAASAQQPLFEDVTHDAGLGQQMLAWGIAAADMDGDGTLDLLFANQEEDTTVLKQLGAFVFDPVLLGDGGQVGAGVEVVSPADVDGDGDLDLLTARWGGKPTLWLNNGHLDFADVTQQAGLALEAPCRSAGAAWGDVNGDGALDLCLGRSDLGDMLFLGHGDGTFTDVTAQAKLGGPSGTEGLTFVDVDNDADPDLLCSRNGGRCALYLNDGKALTDQAPTLGVAARGASLGQVFFDMDNDGDLDLYLIRGGWETEPNRLYRNLLSETGALGFQPATLEARIGDEGMGFGCAVGDVDLDGDEDLFINNHNGPSHLYLNNGDGTFTEDTPGDLVQMGSGCLGAVLADLDNDGDLDLVVRVLDGPDRIFRNTTNTGNWLKVRVHLTNGNTFGYGAHVMVYRAGQLDQPAGFVAMREIGIHQGWCSVPAPEAHFGLPADQRYDGVAVAYGGIRLTATNVAAGQTVELRGP